MIGDGGLSDDFHLKYAVQAFRDWKIWVNMLITIGIFTPLYSISLFLPTIIKELGYTANTTQLMTVPVYVVACFCTICGSFASDKARQRGPFMMGFALVSITGFILLISSGMPQVQYVGTFFAASGKLVCVFPH
jgi:predicted MFS family arabinose efflux permease